MEGDEGEVCHGGWRDDPQPKDTMKESLEEGQRSACMDLNSSDVIFIESGNESFDDGETSKHWTKVQSQTSAAWGLLNTPLYEACATTFEPMTESLPCQAVIFNLAMCRF